MITRHRIAASGRYIPSETAQVISLKKDIIQRNKKTELSSIHPIKVFKKGMPDTKI